MRTAGSTRCFLFGSRNAIGTATPSSGCSYSAGGRVLRVPLCPLSSSGGGWLEVGLAVSEHGVEDVAAAPGEGDQGFVVALVVGDLVVVVGPGDGVAQGRECGQEEGSFEDLVPAAGWG